MKYIIVRNGIYQQGIFGIFSELEKAIEAGKEVLKREKDDYHHLIVHEFEENKLYDFQDGKEICEITRIDEVKREYVDASWCGINETITKSTITVKYK